MRDTNMTWKFLEPLVLFITTIAWSSKKVSSWFSMVVLGKWRFSLDPWLIILIRSNCPYSSPQMKYLVSKWNVIMKIHDIRSIAAAAAAEPPVLLCSMMIWPGNLGGCDDAPTWLYCMVPAGVTSEVIPERTRRRRRQLDKNHRCDHDHRCVSAEVRMIRNWEEGEGGGEGNWKIELQASVACGTTSDCGKKLTEESTTPQVWLMRMYDHDDDHHHHRHHLHDCLCEKQPTRPQEFHSIPLKNEWRRMFA